MTSATTSTTSPLVTLYERHASHTVGAADKAQKFMSLQDFQAALEQDSSSSVVLHPSFTTVLFNLADQQQRGYLSFDEFVMFHDLMKKPHAEYEVAFRLFDRQRRGALTRQEFVQAWRDQHHADLPSDEVVSMYFGKEGSEQKQRHITFKEFSQLVKALQEERLRQRFRLCDPSGSGYVSAEDFVHIIKSTLGHCLSDEVQHHLSSIGNLYARNGGRVSWAEVVAFNNIVRQAEVVRVVAQKAGTSTTDGTITKADFIQAAREHAHSAAFTPMEVDIIFHFAGASAGDLGRVRVRDINALVAMPISISTTTTVKPAITQDSAPPAPTFWTTLLKQVYNFTLGSVAGAIGATVVYPIDLVKTRMQNQRSSVVGELMYKNSLDCFRKVVKNEGLGGLYRGLGPQLVGVAPEKAIKLTMNDLVRSLCTDKDGHISVSAEVLAGCVAGGSQVIFTNPLEIVKIRLQMQGEVAGTARKSAVQIVKELGLVGLYKGAAACLLRDVPFSGIYFTAYSHLKTDYFGESEHKKLSMLELLSAGALAGMPAAYLTTPADVVKTRLQTEARSGQRSYSGLMDAFRTIYKEEGFSALFKGGPARIFRSSPQFGVTLMAYELFKDMVPFPGEQSPHAPAGKAYGRTESNVVVAQQGQFKLAETVHLLRDIDYRLVSGKS